jgi:hypothetical protein
MPFCCGDSHIEIVVHLVVTLLQDRCFFLSAPILPGLCAIRN